MCHSGLLFKYKIINYDLIIDFQTFSRDLNAEDVRKSIIKSTAVITGKPVSSFANEFYKSLSVSLRKPNARAILKRLPGDKHID